MTENSTMLSRSAAKTEVRFEVEAAEVAVLDGFCSANSRSRTDVIREVLKKWSDHKKLEASVICRVAGVNPFGPEGGRNE